MCPHFPPHFITHTRTHIHMHTQERKKRKGDLDWLVFFLQAFIDLSHTGCSSNSKWVRKKELISQRTPERESRLPPPAAGATSKGTFLGSFL